MTTASPKPKTSPKTPKTAAKNSFPVGPSEIGLRLDLFLAKAAKISRKKAKQMIDEGRVFLGPRKIIISSWEMQKGDVIEIRDPNDAVLPRRERYLKVYFEDADLLVVEKPPGVACERSAQTLTGTLVDDINDYLRRAHPGIAFPYVGLMHRLDRETSGIMIYTLSKRANDLSEQFKQHRIGRRYLALVEGAMKSSQGRIDKGIIKDPDSKDRKMKAMSKPGSGPTQAITEFEVKERYTTATLVEARLLTGKTHQVRVHFASMGHPIVGDRLYGSRSPAPRHLLHAAYLEFHHPITEKKMSFRSKVPGDFRKVLEGLRPK